MIEGGPGLLDHFNLFPNLGIGARIQLIANRRILKSRDIHRRPILAPHHPLEQVNLAGGTVIDAPEVGAAADSGRGIARDPGS